MTDHELLKLLEDAVIAGINAGLHNIGHDRSPEKIKQVAARVLANVKSKRLGQSLADEGIAAPDLLEACERLVRDASGLLAVWGNTIGPTDSAELHARIAEAGAAIAKAREVKP